MFPSQTFDTPAFLVGETILDYDALSFSRSTVAYEEDVSGNLIQHAINVPRWTPAHDYIRLEGGYAQVLKHNEDIGNAAWTKTNCTIQTAAFTSPTGGTAKEFVVTGAGDASISQLASDVSTGATTIANHSAYLRSDNGPHDVTVRLAEGANISETTVSVGNTWQRADAILRAMATTPTASVVIVGASGGERVSVWGNDIQIATTATEGQLGSHITTAGSNTNRGQDILTATAGQVPEFLRHGAWGFRWIPSFSFTGTPPTEPLEHGDIVFFSFGAAVQNELVWASWGGARDGAIWVRSHGTSPIAKTNSIRFSRGDVIEVHLCPPTGRLKVSGALSGNGIGTLLQGRWDWEVTTLQIGDRSDDPNSHQLDGYISEPFAVAPF